jgi:hypothetical protein
VLVLERNKEQKWVRKVVHKRHTKIIQPSTKDLYLVSSKATQHHATGTNKQELVIIDVIDWVKEALLYCGSNILGIILRHLHFCWTSRKSMIHKNLL